MVIGRHHGRALGRAAAAGAAMAWLAAALAAQPLELPASEGWVEVRSPNFVVLSDAGERRARSLAAQFENIRAVYQQALPNARVDAPMPVLIYAARNARSFERLLPRYRAADERLRVSGVFLSAEDRDYVAIRADASGANPYQIVYHEYFHLVVRLSLREVPMWVNEGLAEFWSHARFLGRHVLLGEQAPHHLDRLRMQGLIPLEEFFAAGHDSPWYNEPERKQTFYAQAWALVHLLMSGDERGTHRPLLGRLLGALDRGMSSEEAHRQVFGDYARWQRELEGYLRRNAYFALRVQAPRPADPRSFSARPLPAAEAAARHAELMALFDHRAEAAALVERVLAEDPASARAWEVRGQLRLREQDTAGAMEAFARAAEYDSDNFLAHFYRALLLTHEGSAADAAEAEAGLRRALELHPEFPRAWSTLGLLLMRQPGREQEALAAAERAVRLDPGSVFLQANLAHVLLRLERVPEAIRAAQRAAARAQHPAEKSAATGALRAIADYEDSRARRQLLEAADEPARLRRPPAPQTPLAVAPPAPAEPAAETPRRAAPPLRLRTDLPSATATGQITRLRCDADGGMELVLEFDRHTLTLQAEDYREVVFLTAGWTPPANFLPCAHLGGRIAEVKYRVVRRQPFRGEVVSITIFR